MCQNKNKTKRNYKLPKEPKIELNNRLTFPGNGAKICSLCRQRDAKIIFIPTNTTTVVVVCRVEHEEGGMVQKVGFKSFDNLQ